MWRSPRPDDPEWSRLSLRLTEQAGGLINEEAAAFKRLRDHMRKDALTLPGVAHVPYPDRDVYRGWVGPEDDVGHWLESPPYSDVGAWRLVDAWTASFHRLVWASELLCGIATVTEGDLAIELFKSRPDWIAGIDRAAEFYAAPFTQTNPDERSRELERRAATGDEHARRQLCYERIRDRPRTPFRSPWQGDTWVTADPERISGQDVALWWWTPNDDHPGFYIWGASGAIEVGPNWDYTTAIPMNPLYERLLQTWHEPDAKTMEDVWRKPWPWNADRKWKITESSEGDEYWRKVYAFESDVRDALDLSWCLEPEWWAEREQGI
jgi:hypothetical protein